MADISDQAIRAEIQQLINRISSLEFRILELEAKLKKTKKSPALNSMGVRVWEAYREAFLARHKVEPVRNAKVNKNCQDIASRVGVEDGAAIAKFYLTLNDPQFLRMNHPIGFLVMHCESIHSMWKSGRVTTTSQAMIQERQSAGVSASQSYLQRKHGNGQGTR